MNGRSERIAAFLFRSLLSVSVPIFHPFFFVLLFMFVYHVPLFSSFPDFSFFFSYAKRSWNS